MKKPSKVVFIDDSLEEVFESLDGKDPIKKGLIRAIKDLKVNAFAGIQVPKKEILKKKYLYRKSEKFIKYCILRMIIP